MKKKLLILNFMLLLPFMANADVVEINGIYYNLLSKAKEAEVAKRPNGYYSGVVSIPATVTYGGQAYNVTKIGDEAFKMSESLTAVNLTNSITTIGYMAFSGCSSLQTFNIPNSVTTLGYGAFKDCSSLRSVSLPNNITVIDDYMFRFCKSLTSVTIPSSVKEIGCCAFEGCSSITSVSIPDNVVSLGRTFNNILAGSAFKDCTSLRTVTIGNGVKDIHQYSFSGCNSLKTVTVGNSLKKIGKYAFEKCAELADFYCYAELLTNDEAEISRLYTYANAFEGSYINLSTLHVPSSAINDYMSAEPWSSFGKFVAVDNGADLPKCATPEISCANGELTFSCATDGVEYEYEITSEDVRKGSASKVKLAETYKVSVYAKKEGYRNSDVATKELLLGSKGECDLNNDGIIDIGDISHIILVMAGLLEE